MRKKNKSEDKNNLKPTSTQSASVCKTNHISDNPETKDKFGDSHARVADAIAILINSTDTGHTIGVEGSWGSGKSTIIQLLQKKINEESKCHFFIFDAWEHEGDPLRRVFLRKLISKFPFAIMDKNKKIEFEDTIDKLAGPQENGSKGKIVGADWIIFFLFLTLLPLGFDLAVSEYPNITFRTGELNIPFIIGFGIIVGFIISFITAILIYNFCPKKNRTAFVQITSQPSTETLTFNPTSIEFENCFREITSYVFKKGLEKLILVIDNIDRIEPENAKRLLSTLQPFIDKENRDDLNYDRIWVIIPYDLISLMKIWGQSNVLEQQEFAKSFFNKRFQTVFHVPPPIFSKAKSFFVEKFLDAFPDTKHTPKQANAIFSILNYHAKNNSFRLNPREVIKFINQLGTYHIAWQDHISLEEISEYICSIDFSKENDKKDVLDNFILGNSISDNLKNCFLSLFYCQPKTTAYQVHFESLYSSFIEESKYEDIHKYYDLDPESFWAVLADADFKHLASKGCVTNLCRFGNLISSFSDDDLSKESVQNAVLDSFDYVQDWSTIKLPSIDDLTPILESGSSSRIQKLLSNISKTAFLAEKFSTSIIDNSAVEILTEWYKCVSKIIEVSHAIKSNKPKIVISLNASGTLELLMIMMRLPNFEYNMPYFKFAAFDATFEQALIDRINNNSLEEEAAQIPVSSKSLGIDINWTNIAAAIETKFTTNDNHAEQVEYLLPFLLNLSEKDINTTPILNAFTQNIKFFTLMGTPELNEFQTAWLLFVFIFYSVSPTVPSSFPTSSAMNGKTRLVDILNNPSNFPNIMAHLSALVMSNLSPGDCLTASSTLLFSSIVTEILKLSFTDENFSKQLSKEDIFTHWKLIKITSSPEVYKQLLSNRDKLVEFVVLQPFDENNIAFYEDLVTYQQPKHVKNLYSWLTEFFIKKTEPEWVEIFHNNEIVCDFIAFLNMDQNRLILKTDFISGIEAICRVIIDQDQIYPLLESKWVHIKLSYPNHDLFIVSLRKIIQMMINSAKPISPVVLRLLGSDFLDKEVLTSSTEIIPKVFTKIVESNDEYASTWLLSVFIAFPSLLSYFGKKLDISDFKFRVFEKSDENTSNPNNIYQQIILATKWKRPKPKL